jgi:hypothetical protein
MKKTSLSLALTALMGTGAMMGSSIAEAAFFAPNATYTVSVEGGCFAFGDCVEQGLTNVGTGSFTITTDGSGSAFSVGSYSGIAFTATPGGLFETGGTVTGSGTIDDAGKMDLDFTGRTGAAQYFPQYAGNAWNLDNNTKTGGTTGAYEGFTTGTDSNLDPDGSGAVVNTLAGINLSFCPVCQAFTGQLVSVGNVGAQWVAFDGTPYTEVYNIAVTPSAIPVPAAVWLFGSGLLGLVGVARRRKSA